MGTFFLGLFIGIVLGLASPPFYKWIVAEVTKRKGTNAVILLFITIALASCGGNGVVPDDYISWGQAFDHVSKSFSYWLFILLAAAPMVYYVWSVVKGKVETFSLPLMFVFLVLIALAIFMRPSEVAANTTVEQAARGVFIGY